MRASLARTGIAPDHCLDLLRAFTMDATKLRTRDWDDLMVYCRYSASPVGRQVLDLHGESRDTWAPSDALCSALQVINHLQDCGDDFRALNRVYIPFTLLAEHGETVELPGRARGQPRPAPLARPFARPDGGTAHPRARPAAAGGRCKACAPRPR